MHSATNPYITFEIHEVKEIGRKSLSSLGNVSLGTGVIFAYFQISGTVPHGIENTGDWLGQFVCKYLLRPIAL